MLSVLRGLRDRLLGRPPKDWVFDVGHADAVATGWFRGNRLLPGFDFEPGELLVDVGCGDGPYTRFAADAGANVVAIDIDPSAIESVKNSLVGGRAERIRAIVSDCNPIPLEDGVADKVVCSEVLEHVDDPAQLVSELIRIGRQGAQYMISVPDPVAEGVNRHVAPPSYWRSPNHLRVFGREDFVRLVETAGLTVEEQGRYGFYWAMWWTLRWTVRHECRFGEGADPVLEHWNETWRHLLDKPDGLRVKNALDEAMPKSQYVLARKAA